MSKGFSGVPGNMQGLIKQAQKMQNELQKVHQGASQIFAEGSAGGGMVKVTASAENQITGVVIDKQVVEPDGVEMLQDLIQAACNEALKKAQEALKGEFSKVTGGASIPGLF